MVPVARLRWFGHAECKNDASWVKGCMTTEVDVVVRGKLDETVSRKMRKVWNCPKMTHSQGEG